MVIFTAANTFFNWLWYAPLTIARVYLTACLMYLRARVLCVLACLRLGAPDVLACLVCLACLRAFVLGVLMFYVFSCLAYLRFYLINCFVFYLYLQQIILNLIIHVAPARFFRKCVWPFWRIKHFRTQILIHANFMLEKCNASIVPNKQSLNSRIDRLLVTSNN